MAREQKNQDPRKFLEKLFASGDRKETLNISGLF